MRLLGPALVVARRDFISIVATPTFLLFLLAPLLMVAFSAIGGLSAGALARNAGAHQRIVAFVAPSEIAAFRAVDKRLRPVAGDPPDLMVLAADAPDHDKRLRDAGADPEVLAILTGSSTQPRIAVRTLESSPGRYIAAVAASVARDGSERAAQSGQDSTPTFTRLDAKRTGHAAQSGLGYGAVFGIFLLTLLLGGQTVGMLAEEKGNKVIEILAAAAPMEAVFFGKLIGMLGVALLFVAFWTTLLGGGVLVAISSGDVPPGIARALTLTPAIGWPLFLILGLTYFLSAFLLLGAVFLGVGAQASTVREIQMLSLPITFFQVGMFTISTAAASSPGTGIATLAQILPWSSPFAMAARGATDAAIWPHVAALAWQGLWIAVTISFSVRMFRAGVLRSGPSGRGFMGFGRKSRPVELTD